MKNTLLIFQLLFAMVVYSQSLPLIQVRGIQFYNTVTNDTVVLKGLNVSNNSWGFYEWPESDKLEKAGKEPIIRPLKMRDYIFNQIDVENLASTGCNVVRYSFNPELFQRGNNYKESNLELIKTHIQWLEQAGIYTILNMHVPPGLDVANDHFENKFPGNIRQQSVFEDDSVFNVWRDVWQFVANGLKNENALIGYELHNEPKLPALADATTQDLVAAYVEVIDSIRSKDPHHIVFVCEFNSREANPNEQYWSEPDNKMKNDNGFQGTIWDRVWLEMPDSISNLAYVSHVYDPWGFTAGETESSFNAQLVKDAIIADVEFAHKKQKRPLYVSEYGLTYYQNLKNNDSQRINWLNTVHEVFEKYKISTTAWQYKEIINPWTKTSGTYGLWFQYAETMDVKSIENNSIVFASENALKGAQSSGMYDFMNKHLVQNNKLLEFTIANNQKLIETYKSYFKNEELGLLEEIRDNTFYAVLTNEREIKIVFQKEDSHKHSVKVFKTDGTLIYNNDKLSTVNDSVTLSIPELNNLSNKMLIIWVDHNKNQKILIP